MAMTHELSVRAMWDAVRGWSWETAVFRATVGVCLLHALDDAFPNRQPGVERGQHAVGAALSLGLGVGALLPAGS